MTLATLPRLSTVALLALALPLIACGDKDVDDTGPEGDTDTDTDADGDTDADADADTDADTDASGSFSGTVLDEYGAVAQGEVQLCASFCVTQQLDAEGKFLFSNLPSDRYGFHVELGHDIAQGLFFFDVESGQENPMASPYYAIAWENEVELQEGDSEPVRIGGDMWLRVDTTTLQLPLGVDEYLMQGSPVPSELWPDLSTIDGELFGLWYLGPFNASFDPPAPFEISRSLGAEAGEQFRILVADYLGADWADGGTATVNEDGFIYSDEGSGVLYTTTVALVK